jgi:hypothetical protein
MSIADLSINTLCNLRQRQQLFLMPSFRNTPISPYPAYTQQQLDMRRKAEILQYANNRLNTRTKDLTKKERYAQIITGKYQNQSYPTTYSTEYTLVEDPYFNIDRVVVTKTPIYATPTCLSDNMIPTPTSSSDVPGPIINLYYDTSIPLYNYANSSNQLYAITEPVDTDLWKVHYIDTNTAAYNTQTIVGLNTNIIDVLPKTLMSLYITDKIDLSQYTYDVYIPIGFYFFGIYKGSSTSQPSSYTDIELSIPTSGLQVEVQFNSTPVPNTNLEVSFSAADMCVSDISFNVTNGSSDFSGSLYAGILSIKNMTLFTSPGYVYDILITPTITLTVSDGQSSFLENYIFNYGLYYNVPDTTTSTLNCTINTPKSDADYVPIQLIQSLSY